MTSTINPYLLYSGRCEEALLFYEAKLGSPARNDDVLSSKPFADATGMLQVGFENKVMHASFMLLGKSPSWHRMVATINRGLAVFDTSP